MAHHSTPVSAGNQLTEPEREHLMELVKEFRKKNAGVLDLGRYYAEFSEVKVQLDALSRELQLLASRISTVSATVDDMRSGLVSNIVGNNDK